MRNGIKPNQRTRNQNTNEDKEENFTRTNMSNQIDK